MKKTDCIIVGAGLSGLACAITLHRSGVKSLIVESTGTVGGRVKTEKTSDGFLTDVGFR
jgi:phytoene dehydrogenase-like protein